MGAARVGCQVVIPYREEMTKRHLKVTGDLGRVAFIVCSKGIQTSRPVIDPGLGIRSAQHRVDRGGCQTFRCRLQLGWPTIPDKVCSEE